MHKKINIMGMDIDVVDQSYFQIQVREYLANDYMNIIHFMSTSMIERAEQDEEYRELFNRADYLLPGDKTLLLSYYGEEKMLKQIVYGKNGLELDNATVKGLLKVAYIICSKEEDGYILEQFIKKEFSNVEVAGIEAIQDEQDTERVVNGINGVAPDLLLCAIESPLEEEWLFQNSALLNCKLCFALGTIMHEIKKSTKEVPHFVKKLKVEKFYQFFSKQGRKKMYQVRIFRRKIEQYNNKKGE